MYSIKVTDTNDLVGSVKGLSDIDLKHQVDSCVTICRAIMSNEPRDDINTDLYMYCSSRFGSLVDYTLIVLDEYVRRNEHLSDAETFRKLHDKIAETKDMFLELCGAEDFDWEYVNTL